MVLLCYPKCSTCQSTVKALTAQNISFTYRNIKDENPTSEEIEQWYIKSGLPLKKFFNTSGVLYKSLGLKDRLQTMNEKEQIDLLASDGMLVKRPILITKDTILIGREAIRIHFSVDGR